MAPSAEPLRSRAMRCTGAQPFAASAQPLDSSPSRKSQLRKGSNSAPGGLARTSQAARSIALRPPMISIERESAPSIRFYLGRRVRQNQGLFDLEHTIDLHCIMQRQIGHADGGACVASGITEHL